MMAGVGLRKGKTPLVPARLPCLSARKLLPPRFWRIDTANPSVDSQYTAVL